ncbi:recombinase family protein [Streptomyces sp. CB01373]|uniref:recombinase family protein n=1 Tax=Streptomyces sp. CB01373 TaxID=2020325 RepID=UPI002277CC0D
MPRRPPPSSAEPSASASSPVCLTDKGVRVEFAKEDLAFTGEDNPMATLLLSVMGAFAEFERALILERQREGIAAVKARGAYTGRKPALTPWRPC